MFIGDGHLDDGNKKNARPAVECEDEMFSTVIPLYPPQK